MGYRDYSTAKGRIVDSSGHGDFSTIASALTAASAGQTIFIRPGTYTENLTLKAGVNLAAFEGDGDTPNVTISGTCTFSAAGTVSISGIRLQTNSAFCLVVSGANASIVNLFNCYINCTNNTGISFTSSNAASQIRVFDSNGDLGTTGIGLYSHSSAGSLSFSNSLFTNSGGSSTASSNSAGLAAFSWSGIFSPVSVSNTGSFILQWGFINSATQNATSLTTADTGTASIFSSTLSSGTASAISIGTGSQVTCQLDVQIFSTNTNAVTGAGTFGYGNIIFPGAASKIINVTTQSPQTIVGGGWSFIRTLTASASATLDFTTLPTYSTYAFVIKSLVLATNAQQLLFRLSGDNGSTFAATNYRGGVNYTSYNSATVTNINSTTQFPITSNASNGTGINGTIYYSVPVSNVWGESVYQSTDSGVPAFAILGGDQTTVNANAFRFLSSSGNLASGSITIYGLL